MKWMIRVVTRAVAVVVALSVAVLVASAQAARPNPAPQSPEVSLQRRVAVLEQEVRSLKGELAALRVQSQRSGSSTQTPGASGSSARPSVADVSACMKAFGDGPLEGYGDIQQLEFGATTTSQGGMQELGMGAPKGTTIFPAKLKLGGYDRELLVFKDSFGTWKCHRT